MAAKDGCCSSPQPGKWVTGRAVGSGSFGTVNLAMDTMNGSLFVVKSAQSGPAFNCLRNEVDILDTLQSPYIIRCLGSELSFSATSGKSEFGIFLEYMAGGSLFDVAEKFGGVLDEQVIRAYTREILQGLQFIHEKGIVHCDLKCRNLLLGSSGNIKLADFGCAKRVADKSSVCYRQPSICGTPLWMAPEVLRNEEPGLASDIWSLGCTIIEMATGRPPWSDIDSNPMAAVLRIACSCDTPSLPAKMSSEGVDFLRKCLERNPDRRWTAKELLSHPFVSIKSKPEEDACSPASVLELGVKEEGYDSDESECQNDGEFLSRTSFKLRINCGNGTGMEEGWQAKSESLSASSWVTVRSG